MNSVVVSIVMAALAPVEVESGGVRMQVRVQANEYAYELRNLSAAPVVRVEIPYRHSYTFEVPKGWKLESEHGLFRAWTDDPAQAIRPQGSGAFSFRAASKGAVLGNVDVNVVLDDGRSITLPQVWSTVSEPPSVLILAAALTGLLMLLHTVLAERRARRRGKFEFRVPSRE